MILPLFEYSSNIINILTISNLNFKFDLINIILHDFIANKIYFVVKLQSDLHVQKAREKIVSKYFLIGEDHKIKIEI